MDLGELETALELFDELAGARALAPDELTYAYAIQACARAEQWEAAVATYGKMRDAGVAHDATTVNTLVRACERAGQWKLAFDFMRALSEGGADGDGESEEDGGGGGGGGGEAAGGDDQAAWAEM